MTKYDLILLKENEKRERKIKKLQDQVYKKNKHLMKPKYLQMVFQDIRDTVYREPI